MNNNCEKHFNRAITTQSWGYLVYLRDLAVHKDHLPHHRMTSQSVLLLLCHLLIVGNVKECLHDDISGPCVSLVILAPELRGAVPFKGIPGRKCPPFFLLVLQSCKVVSNTIYNADNVS